MLALGAPERIIATGVHQSYGGCDESAVDLFGYTRRRYLCREAYDEDFHFGCSQQALPPAEPSWYTLCGAAHTAYERYVATAALIALTAACGIGGMLLLGGAARAADAAKKAA
eukprot:3803102-Prymnesium_polylepis.1